MHHLKFRITAIAIIAVLLAVVSGCSNKGSKLAATVGDMNITIAELDFAVEEFKQQFAAQGQVVADEQLPAFRADVLENLVRKAALLNRANTLNITADPEEVDAEFDKIKTQFPDEEQFIDALSGQNYTVEGLRKQISDDLAIAELIDQEVLSKIEIPEDTLANFYTENNHYFVIPETVTASHILIQVAENASDEDVTEAREKASAILEELKAGADFAETAKEKSEGPSGPTGGDLGAFGRGQMVGPFEEAAFALEPGELSDLVKTQFGFHIIHVREKEEGYTRTYDEVREEILEFLRQSEGEDDVTSYIAELVDASEIKYHIK